MRPLATKSESVAQARNPTSPNRSRWRDSCRKSIRFWRGNSRPTRTPDLKALAVTEQIRDVDRHTFGGRRPGICTLFALLDDCSAILSLRQGAQPYLILASLDRKSVV